MIYGIPPGGIPQGRYDGRVNNNNNNLLNFTM
jgi:hypothetical protein